jgi:putative membrane protein
MKFKEINSQTIEAEIEKFESKVDFEFIPVITEQSSYTEHVGWGLSLILSILFISLIEVVFALFFHDSWSEKSIYFVLAVSLAIILTRFLSRMDAVKRLFISKAEKHRQVHEKAHLVFSTKRLQDIKSNNALLLFVSIMEKHIVLLPDPRIKVQNMKQIDDELLAILQKKFKQHEYENGIIQAIQCIQGHLQDKFPRQGAVENTVPNKLVWWRD